MNCTVLLQLNMAKRRQVLFSDVGPETEEAYKLDALHRLDARNPWYTVTLNLQ